MKTNKKWDFERWQMCYLRYRDDLDNRRLSEEEKTNQIEYLRKELEENGTPWQKKFFEREMSMNLWSPFLWIGGTILILVFAGSASGGDESASRAMAFVFCVLLPAYWVAFYFMRKHLRRVRLEDQERKCGEREPVEDA